MPNSTASNSRSKEKITRKNGAGAPRRFAPRRAVSGLRLTRFIERRDDLAGLVLVGEDHDLLARLPELLQVLVHHAAELRLHHARVRPFSVLVPADRADDGLDLVLAQPAGERLVLEALGGVDRLLENLADRIVERRQIEAEGVHLGFGGALRVAREEFVDARILHPG